MAWRGADEDRTIWWSRIQTVGSDLTGVEPVWGPQNASWFKTVGFPTLVEHGNRIFMAWMERVPVLGSPPQTRNQMYWSELLGDRWGERQELWVPTIQDGQGVAIAEHRGQMVMAWRDNSPAGRIWARRHDGQFWVGEPKVIEPEMRCSNVPALASDGINLHMAVQGADDNHIWWTVFEGVTPEGRLKWRAPQPLRDRRTTGGPALRQSFDQGEMVMVWRGADNDTNLWWSYFHDGQWGSQRAMGDRWLNINDTRASLA
jgi:hypothetical protein